MSDCHVHQKQFLFVYFSFSVCVCVFNPLSLSLRGLATSCSSSLSLCPWLSSLLRSACSCGVCSWPTEGRSYSLLCFGVHSFFHLPLLSTKQVSHARQSNGLPHPSLLPPCLLLRSLLMASGRLVSLHVLQPFLCLPFSMRCAFGPPWSDHVIPPYFMPACLPALPLLQVLASQLLGHPGHSGAGQ